MVLCSVDKCLRECLDRSSSHGAYRALESRFAWTAKIPIWLSITRSHFNAARPLSKDLANLREEIKRLDDVGLIWNKDIMFETLLQIGVSPSSSDLFGRITKVLNQLKPSINPSDVVPPEQLENIISKEEQNLTLEYEHARVERLRCLAKERLRLERLPEEILQNIIEYVHKIDSKQADQNHKQMLLQVKKIYTNVSHNPYAAYSGNGTRSRNSIQALASVNWKLYSSCRPWLWKVSRYITLTILLGVLYQD